MKDVEYWKEFYSKNKLLCDPSNFCLFLIDFIKDKEINTVMDAGCGNGRDSYKLAEKYNVLGIDSSEFIVKSTNNFKFLCGDFVAYDKTNFDMIYSRFTFHSLTNEQQDEFIKSVKEGTYLCIETRSDKSQNETRHYGDSHFRNLTNVEYLKKLVTKNNFEILYLEEDRGFAKYKKEDPYCIRMVCKK
jgi:ubiquinone/menaquinone biosynthesis C-methylase UbiE